MNNVKKSVKKSQIEMSYGMIFSIILIIVFIAVAIYVIAMFFGMQCSIKIGQFTKDLQKDVNNIWAADGGQEVTNSYTLCNKIEEVCFFNDAADQKGSYSVEDELFRENHNSGDNLCFYPKVNILCTKVSHLNLNSLTSNPYCLKVTNGAVKVTLKKSSREDSVKVS
ncbi:MAG: hypothetical protein WC796_00490 [Candidatus Pacearchaeota archaeon]|jgi:hypothetical protein